MNIVIVGAGIGGLTAALCLIKSGHKVTVVDRAFELTEVGAGVQLGANALRVMDSLGLLEALTAVSVEPDKISFRDHQTGQTLYERKLGGSYQQQYGAPYYHIHRADLQKVLVDALNRLSPNALELNALVTAYTESDDDVVVHIDDDRHIKTDCLIGADGIKSMVRDQLLGKQKPQFTGYVAWRGIADARHLPSGWMDKIVSNFVGPQKHMVLYYLRNQQLVNMVGVVKSNPLDDANLTNSSWVTKASWQELKSDFSGWHDTVQTLIDLLDKDQCYRWALHSHQPFSNWSSDRVTLLGDAAHSTLPYMASGAAMAIEDGCVLSRALEQATNLQEGLQLYQRNRISRTAKIQASSVTLGRCYHLSNRYVQRAAFAGMKMLGDSKERFLAGYDANSVPLI